MLLHLSQLITILQTPFNILLLTHLLDFAKYSVSILESINVHFTKNTFFNF